ncbi:MAG: hypothetical protein ACREQ5_03660 [Candidatus Dormibacteria bacterium]
MGHIRELPDDTMDWKFYYSHGLPPGASDAQWRKFIGNRGWEMIHGAIENYPCSLCRESGTRLFRGVHDMVNVFLEKPVAYPKDLLFLQEQVDLAVKNVKSLNVPTVRHVQEPEMVVRHG